MKTPGQAFDTWWDLTGRLIDVDPGVSWYDKRRETAMYSFDAGMREGFEAARERAAQEAMHGVCNADCSHLCHRYARSIAAAIRSMKEGSE